MKNKKLTNEELAVFSGQLAMILHSGISILEGISILCEDAPTEEGKQILEQVYHHLEETGDLVEAFRAPGVYPDYFIHMAALGEISGTMEEVMDALSRHYEREFSIAQSIRSALTYPFIMFGMLLAVLIVLVVQVMPVFRQVFTQMGIEMNGIAEGIYQAGQILSGSAVFLLIALLLLAALLLYAFRNEKLRPQIFSFFRRLSRIRSISESLSCSRFSSALSIALHSGLAVDQSLSLAGDLIEDPAFHLKIEAALKSIEEGEDFSSALRSAGIYSGMNARLLSIGERTGSAEIALDKIAVSCQEESDNKIQGIVSILEPTMVAVLSILTGLILLSVMLPLLGVMSGIG